MSLNAKKKRVLFLAENLLGQGHGRRITAIAEACQALGFETALLSGTVFGEANLGDTSLDDVGLGNTSLENPSASSGRVPRIALPEIRWDGPSFTQLVDHSGNPVTEDLWQRRRDQSHAAITRWKPNALVIEGFPFARRRFTAEIRASIKTAREGGASIICSVRDVIQPLSSTKKIQTCLELLNTEFDAILIHGDPKIAAFNRSFPQAADITIPVHTTGYVDHAPSPPPLQDQERLSGHIVVAAGGGAAGQALYEAALAAAESNAGCAWSWVILTGAHTPYKTKIPENVLISANRPDYRSLLAQATCSVSQCGYNTAMDLAQCSTPAVVVPFEGEGEQEQSLRATCFAALGWWQLLREGDLSPQTLLSSIAAAQDAGPKPRRAHDRDNLDLKGATRSATLIAESFSRNGFKNRAHSPPGSTP